MTLTLTLTYSSPVCIATADDYFGLAADGKGFGVVGPLLLRPHVPHHVDDPAANTRTTALQDHRRLTAGRMLCSLRVVRERKRHDSALCDVDLPAHLSAVAWSRNCAALLHQLAD